ncbi:hypothetical protein ACHAWF_011956 [Thalassiosira exigua]
MRLLPIYRDSNGDYGSFKELVNSSDLLGGIDDNPHVDDDEAHELSQQLWLEVESSSTDREQSILSFIEYLKLIQSHAKGFVYELATDSRPASQKNSKKRLLSVLRQTATMRRNFELFGSYIGLDMMKKGMSSLLWTYVAVAMYDESNRVCLGCDGMLIGERDDMYAFLARFLGKHSPCRPLSDVLIVAGDKYIARKFIHSGLQSMFGQQACDLLKGQFNQMIYARTESLFQEAASAAKNLLIHRRPRNAKHEEALSEFISQKEMYAEYILRNVVSNRGYRGSTMAEQNHSSVLSCLGYEEHGRVTLTTHPNNAIRDLLGRQNRHTKRTNHILFGHVQKLRATKADLRTEVQTAVVEDLLKAASSLSFPDYERYKSNRTSADTTLERVVSEATATREEVVTVRAPASPNSQVRVFKCDGDRCNCVYRIEHEGMCEHEICAYGGFRNDLFVPRHFFGTECTGLSMGAILLFAGQGSFSATSKHRKNANILPAVSVGYSDFSSEVKFQSADLAIQMQDIITNSIHKVSRTEMNGTLSVDVPDAFDIQKQPRKRLKPLHERLGESFSKKRSNKLASLGITQVVEGNNLTVQCNAERSAVVTCGFCMGNHYFPHCKNRELLKMRTMEYILTTETPHIETSLRQQLFSGMPLSELDKDKVGYIGSLTTKLLNSNFIIYGAVTSGKGDRKTYSSVSCRRTCFPVQSHRVVHRMKH